MKYYGLKIGSLLGAAALIGAGAAQADALSTPSMSSPLAANATPTTVDAGPIGNIFVTGAVSGLAFYQSNSTTSQGNHEEEVDFSNAQVFIQKTDGLVQFFAEVGGYSLPALGAPYVRATTQTANSFGIIPVAYLKIAPTDSFNIEAGKLPTLIGAEYTFTFQNTNIERGLLWNQEPAISQGVQANYTSGPITASLSVNDGFYSDRFNWLSGSLAYAINSTDTVTAVGGGNLGYTDYPNPSTAPVGNPTPLLQNNGGVYNLIWAHTDGPWTITPYFQYTTAPSFGRMPSSSTISGAVIANYAFDSNWSLGGRAEYISASNHSSTELYGPGSDAWSLTLTPTYQYKVFFARAEFSYVGVGHSYPGLAFGTDGTDNSQVRVLLETGILF